MARIIDLPSELLEHIFSFIRLRGEPLKFKDLQKLAAMRSLCKAFAQGISMAQVLSGVWLVIDLSDANKVADEIQRFSDPLFQQQFSHLVVHTTCISFEDEAGEAKRERMQQFMGAVSAGSGCLRLTTLCLSLDQSCVVHSPLQCLAFMGAFSNLRYLALHRRQMALCMVGFKFCVQLTDLAIFSTPAPIVLFVGQLFWDYDLPYSEEAAAMDSCQAITTLHLDSANLDRVVEAAASQYLRPLRSRSGLSVPALTATQYGTSTTGQCTLPRGW